MNQDGKEIERKFLIKKLPPELINTIPAYRCEQGYLCVRPEFEVRISNRLEPHLTCKRGYGITRQETIEEVSETTFEILWNLTEGKRVIKYRYFYPLDNNLTAEIDIYSNFHLETVEVEFSSEEAAKQFIPPDWFGEDVTYNIKYRNSQLAC